ncbi:MAG: prohibitin family protein [Chloroflexaceae bacterium]|nr:prohibitin family protein [Chloroflexaceae bacterium]
MKKMGLAIIIGISVVFMGLVLLSWRNVRPGYVGIVFDRATHKVTTGALEPGWAFINPFTQSIQEYPVTIQTYAMVQKTGEGSTIEDDSITVQSSEGQQLSLDVFVQYRVKRTESAALYQDWGGADITVIEDRVVRQYSRSQVRDIVSQYGWQDITSDKRVEITQKVEQSLQQEFDPLHLELVAFGIRGIHLPESLQRALDRKIEAQQQAEQQQYQLEQARIKADQDRVEAEGRAAALRAEAEGTADAIRIRAKAQSEANRILAQHLTPDLIRYFQIERWDGRLPVFSGSEATPLMDMTEVLTRSGSLPALR